MSTQSLPDTTVTTERVFTFGYGHTEPGAIPGERVSLAEKYALVRAATAERCREVMLDYYGNRWAFEYDTVFEASVGGWSPELHVTLVDGPTGYTVVYATTAGGAR